MAATTVSKFCSWVSAAWALRVWDGEPSISLSLSFFLSLSQLLLSLSLWGILHSGCQGTSLPAHWLSHEGQNARQDLAEIIDTRAPRAARQEPCVSKRKHVFWTVISDQAACACSRGERCTLQGRQSFNDQVGHPMPEQVVTMRMGTDCFIFEYMGSKAACTRRTQVKQFSSNTNSSFLCWRGRFADCVSTMPASLFLFRVSWGYGGHIILVTCHCAQSSPQPCHGKSCFYC